MHIKNQLKLVKIIFPLLLAVALLIFVSFETRSVIEPTDQDLNYLLKCGYIRRNIANTIFNPNFILYLSRQQKIFNTLNESDIKDFVEQWNTRVADRREIIHYKQGHFNKLANLSKSGKECNDIEGCTIKHDDLAVLQYWMSDITVDVAEAASTDSISPAALKRMNIENDPNIEKALEIIMEDPVGSQVIANIINLNATVRSEKLHAHKGYFEYLPKTIVIDPTVVDYIFKINCIVHELVHASSLGKDNSIFEETYAEIIGMAVQDRITGIDISCHPYVVFIDRLLDSHYGKYPVRNNIEKHLQKAGIVIKIKNDKID